VAQRNPSFLKAVAADPAGPHRLVNQRHGGIVASKLLCAFDSQTRKTGLLKHQALPDDEAMIIAPCNAVHTFFMRFPIDIAFVARDGRVLKVSSAVKPWRIAVGMRAFAVIELASGILSKNDTRPGDFVVVQ